MASRTYANFKRGSVTLTDYFNWRDRSPAGACESTNNPAFLNGRASTDDIEAAKATCAGCPLLAGCDFFAHTKHWRDFDGVMGGNLFLNALDDDYGRADVEEDTLEDALV